MFGQLLSVMIKELRQMRRDKRTLGILLVAPVLQLLVLGFAVDLDVSDVPAVTVDADHTGQSREFLRGLLADDTFTEVAHVESAREAMDLIVAGDASVAFVVPKGFSQSVSRAEPPSVQAWVDGGDVNRATIAQNAITSYALSWTGDPLRKLTAPTELRTVIRYNPGLLSPWYLVPGIAGTLLLTITTIVSAMGFSREKETGTLEQVLVTPISAEIYLLGKVVPPAGIGLVTLLLIVAAGRAVFGVPLRGSLFVLMCGGAVYLLSALGVGLVASAFAKNQQQAFINAFFVLLPATLLSGFMTPINNIPEPLRTMTMINPMRHFVSLSRAVMLKGAGFADLGSQFLALTIIGLVMFFGASRVMRMRFGR